MFCHFMFFFVTLPDPTIWEAKKLCITQVCFSWLPTSPSSSTLSRVEARCFHKFDALNIHTIGQATHTYRRGYSEAAVRSRA